MFDIVKPEEVTPEEKQLALIGKFEAIDFETGELINVLDASIPVSQRLDASKWLIDRLNAEIELCKDRKRLWNEREDVFKIAIDNIRDCIKASMVNEGVEKLKTLENTAFLTSKEIITFDESKVPDTCKVFDVAISGCSISNCDVLRAYISMHKLTYSAKERVDIDKLPAEYKSTKTVASLTIRKSPKSN